jgi:O-antigen ligase
MAASTTTAHPAISKWNRGQLSLLLLLAAIALVVGITVAEGKWAYLPAFALLPLLLLWPVETSLGAFVLLLPFDSVAGIYGEGSRTLLWFAGGLAACTLLLVGLVSKRLDRPARPAYWWLAFFLWGAASLLWAYSPEHAFKMFPTAAALIMFYLVAACFRVRARELNRIVLLLILGSCAAAVITLYQFHNGQYFTNTVMRASLIVGGSETNPNVLALSFVLPIGLAMARFLTVRRWLHKALLLAAITLSALALLVTMSRGGLLALAVLLLVFFLRLHVSRKLLFSVAGLMLGLTFLMPKVFFHRLGNMESSGGSGRIYIWKAGFEAFKHSPVMGAGLNNFPAVYDRYAGYAAPIFNGFGRDPHNIYLGMAVDGGLIGLALFLMVVDSQRRTIAQCRKIAGASRNLLIACEGALWGTLAFAMTGNILWNKVFWLLWILLALTIRVVQNDGEEHSAALSAASLKFHP